MGAPSVTLSPPTTKTSPNSTISPSSPFNLATLSTSSAATRYCLPPVLKTANIFFVLVFGPVLGFLRPDRLLAVVSADGYRRGCLEGTEMHWNRRPYGGGATPLSRKTITTRRGAMW